jgi:hypothetical protein
MLLLKANRLGEFIIRTGMESIILVLIIWNSWKGQS